MNCCNTNDFVSATIKQSRAFATLGLLRLVTDATPLDQIITYASETNQKYFLDLNNLGSFDAKPDDVAQRSSMYVIPDGLRKMSKDYLIRKFWKNISWLMNQAQVHLERDLIHPTRIARLAICACSQERFSKSSNRCSSIVA